MSSRERIVLLFILLFISVTVAIDLVTDARGGAAIWHLLTEGFVGLLALFGTFYLLKDMFSLKRDLIKERESSLTLRQEADEWRSRSKKYLEGLSNSIDEQLTAWNLSPAEKEVAFLLLKGLSLKEIAQLRNTMEKTARVQSMAIYSKAGLAGRSELAAFFLEDLLLPARQSETNLSDNGSIADNTRVRNSLTRIS
jgi:DNA-binding CsgD family transcriptional regulator